MPLNNTLQDNSPTLTDILMTACVNSVTVECIYNISVMGDYMFSGLNCTLCIMEHTQNLQMEMQFSLIPRASSPTSSFATPL